MSPKPNERRNTYKSTVDANEARRRREDNMVEIRKNRREENLQKKRREVESTSMDEQDLFASLSPEKRVERIPEMIVGVMSHDNNLQLAATIRFRRLLSLARNPPIDEVVQSGVVPRLVQFLSRDDFPQLQFEAAWVLTNIASGTSKNTMDIVDSGAVPLFIKLLSSSNEEIREQCVWALGNVAGESPTCRNFVLSSGVMMPLLAQFNEHSKPSMLRNATWALSNFCRGKPEPALEHISPALPYLEKLLHLKDEEVLTDALWSLSYLTDGANIRIQSVIDSGALPCLVQNLVHPSQSVLTPAVRTIGNIVTGDDLQTQAVIDNQALPGLLKILQNTYKKNIKKETLWTISNITAGNQSQIQQVIEAGIMQHVISLLQYGEFVMKKEAVYAVTNALSGGTHEQIKFLVDQRCIKPLCDILTCPDAGVLSVALLGLEKILKAGEIEKNLGNTCNINEYAHMIDEADGWSKMERLQDHDNTNIYMQVVKLIETYWGEDDD